MGGLLLRILYELLKMLFKKRPNANILPSDEVLYVRLGWDPDLILAAIQKKFLPTLKYKVEKDEIIRNKNGEISQQIISCTVNDKQLKGTFNHLQPVQFIEKLNEVLAGDLKGKFIEADTDGDEYAFIIK